MGLFDGDFSLDGGGYADVATVENNWGAVELDYNPQVNDFNSSMFGDYSTDPAGVTDIAARSNSSFWDFDQSKISAGIFDVLNSGVQAGGKLLVQQASDSINSGTQSANPWLSGFAKNFQSTQTGAQINAGAYATRIQNFFANPIVWMVGAGLALFLLFRR